MLCRRKKWRREMAVVSVMPRGGKGKEREREKTAAMANRKKLEAYVRR